jgi:hypothetical protein
MGRPRRYGPEVTEALVKLWEAGDRMCGKLLVAVLPAPVAQLALSAMANSASKLVYVKRCFR